MIFYIRPSYNIIVIWFYQLIKAKHDILDGDIYNMNVNNYIIGINRSSKVVFSKYQKQDFIK